VILAGLAVAFLIGDTFVEARAEELKMLKCRNTVRIEEQGHPGIPWYPRWNHDTRKMRLATAFKPFGRNNAELQIIDVKHNGKIHPRGWERVRPPGYTPQANTMWDDVDDRGAEYSILDMCWLSYHMYMFSALTIKANTNCPGDSCGGFDIYKENATDPSFYSKANDMMLAAASRVPLALYYSARNEREDASESQIMIVNPQTGWSDEIRREEGLLESVFSLALHPDGRFVAWHSRERVSVQGENDEYFQELDFDVVVRPLEYDPIAGTAAQALGSPPRSGDDPRNAGLDELLMTWDPSGALRYACYRSKNMEEGDDGTAELIIVDINDDGSVRDIAIAADNAYVRLVGGGPAWSPDGKRIYYMQSDDALGNPIVAVDVETVDGRSSVGDKYRVDLDNGATNHYEIAVAPNGKTLAVTADSVDHGKSLFLTTLK